MTSIRTNLNKLLISEIEELMYNTNMNARKIKKSYISCTGYFASYKNKTQIAFESVLERDFYMLLEFDDNVVLYAEQPITINYKYKDGSNRKYTPDCIVNYVDRTEKYFEVKYKSDIDNDIELSEKLQFLKSYFNEEYSSKLKVFTDEDFSKVYLDNLKFLYKFAFFEENKEKLEVINQVLNSVDNIKVKDLITKLENNSFNKLQWLPHVWKYIFLHNNVVNLYEKLTMNTLVQKGFV